MSEEFNIQTQKLQRFIDGEICLDELSIDKDVLEGLFVLRPELAPKPKVLIDKVWAEHQNKTETSEFSESESMLILDRPLPLPNVNIEDILSSLENGPLVKDTSVDKDIFENKVPKQNETFGFGANQNNPNSNIIEFAEANKRAEQLQNNRWQLWVGALVAASVLFIMVPSSILNSYESSIQSPTFSQNSEKIELNNVRFKKLQEDDIPKSAFEQESVPEDNIPIQKQQPERSLKPKSKKTKARKKKTIPSFTSETLPKKFESRSSNEVVPEKKQKDLDEEISLVPTNIIREEIPSELKITKEVKLESTSIANDSLDALSDNYDLDIGDMSEERSTYIEYTDDNIEEIDIVARQEKRPSKRSRNDLRSKRRSQSSTMTIAQDAPAPPEGLIAEDRAVESESERITEEKELLEKQNITSNVLIKIQIYDVSGSLNTSATDISFQYGTQSIIPYKSTDGFWVFSMPESTVGKLVVGNIQSDVFLAKEQHICRMADQKLICK